MITLAQVMRDHHTALIRAHKADMQPRHYAAMQSIMDCHTPASGELHYQCPSCEHPQIRYRSCGNRQCPACQHDCNNHWLDRQRQKLLPVNYFMVTFTLPRQLRHFVWHHQSWAYPAMFKAAVATLRVFFKNDKALSCVPGLTGVLHTHSRRLDFHPHCHFIVPGGGLRITRRSWVRLKRHYLFNAKKLAAVFRGKFITAMSEAGFYIPARVPKQWICHCESVGKGEQALVYLARYLYRGVLSEKNIVRYHKGLVSFRYLDSESNTWKIRTETVVNFLWLFLQHTLPKGFRRSRDYGFLHGNAKKWLLQLHLKFRVAITPPALKPIKVIACQCCGFAMQFVGLIRRLPRNRPLRLPIPLPG